MYNSFDQKTNYKKEIYAMSILSQSADFEKDVEDTVSRFLRDFHIGKILQKCNGEKMKDIPSMQIFRYKLCNVFNKKSMYIQMKTNRFQEDFSKNTFYRFINNAGINWLRFTAMLSASIINGFLRPLTKEDRADAFIIDDSLYERKGFKKTQMASKVFDHVSMKFKKGFRLLTLGYSDGVSFMPINFCLLASSKEQNQLGVFGKCDKRSLAGRRRELATTKATDVMLKLLRYAIRNGHKAKYVLFDSWFSNPHQLVQIKDMGMTAIAMVKLSSKIQYLYNGEKMNIKQIYSRNKKRRGRSRYLLSVNVTVGKEAEDEHTIPAKIVCVRNRANRKEWLALICTDTSLSEEEIIRIYGKRWDIEVFFKTCKSYLNLISECHSLSYDALNAHVAFVFTRYMLLSVYKRKDTDERTIGDIFYQLIDEMEDITYNKSMLILTEAMLCCVQDTLQLSDEKVADLAKQFYAKLPEYIQKALSERKEVA